MKPQPGMGNQMDPSVDQMNLRNQRLQQQLQQNPAMANPNDPASQGIMGSMGNIQQLLQQRMGGMQRPGMPQVPSAEQRPGYGPGLPPGMPPAYGAGGRFGQPNYGNPDMDLNTGQSTVPQAEPPVSRFAPPGYNPQPFTPPQVNRPDMSAIQQRMQSALQQGNARRDAYRAGGGTVPTAMPAGKMAGGMNPYSAKLKAGGINPANVNTVTTKLRPSGMSDMSAKPPTLRVSNPASAKRMVPSGQQQSRGAWLQNATKKFGKPQV